MAPSDLYFTDSTLLAVLVFVHSLNYNDLVTSALIQIPLFGISHYVELLEIIKIWWSPYTHKPFANTKE